MQQEENSECFIACLARKLFNDGPGCDILTRWLIEYSSGSFSPSGYSRCLLGSLSFVWLTQLALRSLVFSVVPMVMRVLDYCLSASTGRYATLCNFLYFH